jgi:uncharacterized protein
LSPVQRAKFSAFALALGLYAATPATADVPACEGRDLTDTPGLADARARRADDLVNSDGLLWRIEKAGVTPSWLFGTIHSTDDRALAMARRAAQAIDGAKLVATELGAMDTVEEADVGAAMLRRALDRDHDTFQGLPAENRDAVEKLIADEGYPSDFAHHLKLWFLAILTAMPPCETKRQILDLPEVDRFLAETAKRSGVKVIGLETADEQLDAIAAMRPDVASALISLTARDPGLSADIYASMLKLYRESRPAEILPLSDVVGNMTDAERAAEDEFMRLLLVGRNATMAERLAPVLTAGGAFVAVGALHLAGKTGLIERLRSEGFTVTKVW